MEHPLPGGIDVISATERQRNKVYADETVYPEINKLTNRVYRKEPVSGLHIGH
jgi:hypothetical protein